MNYDCGNPSNLLKAQVELSLYIFHSRPKNFRTPKTWEAPKKRVSTKQPGQLWEMKDGIWKLQFHPLRVVDWMSHVVLPLKTTSFPDAFLVETSKHTALCNDFSPNSCEIHGGWNPFEINLDWCSSEVPSTTPPKKKKRKIISPFFWNIPLIWNMFLWNMIFWMELKQKQLEKHDCQLRIPSEFPCQRCCGQPGILRRQDTPFEGPDSLKFSVWTAPRAGAILRKWNVALEDLTSLKWVLMGNYPLRFLSIWPNYNISLT